ncbi:pumilio homolog 12-like [Diospyros lotus]|uniref:pumilio homolog 12-like n=1 Tax=Diospyros lotus TaxID=55363 RepID=UPI002253BBFD|nr:pumilio homolog 12-like [Diospyros lotus]
MENSSTSASASLEATHVESSGDCTRLLESLRNLGFGESELGRSNHGSTSPSPFQWWRYINDNNNNNNTSLSIALAAKEARSSSSIHPIPPVQPSPINATETSTASTSLVNHYNLAHGRTNMLLGAALVNNHHQIPSHMGQDYYSTNYQEGQEERIPSTMQGQSNLVWLAKTEKGSKYLQALLLENDPEITRMVLKRVFEHMVDLMSDQHGQYLFQTLLGICDIAQLDLIVRKVTSQSPLLVRAATTKYGSISIQKLIRRLKKMDLVECVTSVLYANFFQLMTDRIGRMAIKECAEYLDSRQNEVLYEAVIWNVIELATDPVGCISLNDCIECMIGSQRERLLARISDESVRLSRHPSGNFVVQNVLKLEVPSINEKICKRLRGNYARLSQVKSGSHLVEKCLRCSWGMDSFVQEMKSEKGALQKLARDKFGNYVVQRALELSKEHFTSHHEYLLTALGPCLSSLQQSTYGKHVFCKITQDGAAKLL